MSFIEKINNGYYAGRDLVYPTKPNVPLILNKRVSELTSDDIATLNDVNTEYAKQLNEYEVAKTAYSDTMTIRGNEFYNDLRSEYGTDKSLNNKQEGLLFNYAWEKGHSYGHHQVVYVYSELVDLLVNMEIIS